MLTLTVRIANVTPEAAAVYFYRHGLAGTALPHVGFCSPYGIEPGTSIVFGGLQRIDLALRIVRGYLAEIREASAWVEVPGHPNADFTHGTLVYALAPDAPDVQGERRAAPAERRA